MNTENLGFDPQEIAQLKQECADEGNNFVMVEDEENMSDSEEFAHFQFVGKYQNKEVIYDAVLSTLRLNHSSLLYEEAESQVKKLFPKYVSIEDRKPNYQGDEEAELLLEELIEQLEEDEAVKVSESLELDEDFDYGIGLDVSLNVDVVNTLVVSDFIKQFNAGTFRLDTTLYSFKNIDEGDDE